MTTNLANEMTALHSTARQRVEEINEEMRILRVEREEIIRLFRLHDMRARKNGPRNWVIGGIREALSDGQPHRAKDILASVVPEESDAQELQRVRQSVYAALNRQVLAGEFIRVRPGWYQLVTENGAA